MKASLLGLAVFFLLGNGPFRLHAQTNTSPQVAREAGMLSFLTPAQQLQYAKARAKALADNPELKTEGEDLMQQGESVMADGTAEDKQAFIEKMSSHRQKLRQAMLKEDASLEPIFAEIDKHISEAKAEHSGQMQSSSSATNAPPASPSTSH